MPPSTHQERGPEGGEPCLLEEIPTGEGSDSRIDLTGSSQATLRSVNPATGATIETFGCAGPAEIDRAVETAVAMHALYRGSSWKEKHAHLRRLASLLEEQAEDLAELVALEQGKPKVEALALEILPAIDHLCFLLTNAERLTASEGIWPRHPFYAHKRSHYLYDPVGVVALITPFNLPLAIPLIQVAAALAAGNSVILKPSELTPCCGNRIGELVAQAGFARGLVQVIHTDREDTLFLVAHPQVDKIFFTGSRETAQKVMAGAGWMPRPIVIASGGKHPAVVSADADLDRTARAIVWGAFANGGQNCGAVERVYVEQPVAARFMQRILDEVDRLVVGDPLATGVDLGPLASEKRREEVHAQVLEAIALGAHRLRGGEIPSGPGFYYPPTVLLNPPSTCRMMREETLGPVLPIVVTENLEQAILLANDSEYALTASGFTSSPGTADRMMEGLRAGVVTVNDVLYSFGEPASTWSGHKASGVGYNHGKAGLREMFHAKFASYDQAPVATSAFAFPYDAAALAVIERALVALHGRGRFTRLGALVKLVFSRRFRRRVPVRSFLPAWKNRSR